MENKAAIRVLHVVYSLDPGGMENGIVNIAGALDPSNFQVDVCCIERAGAFAQRLPSSSQVSVLGKPPGFSLSACVALRRQIRKCKPHLVHAHNLGPLIYSALATGWGTAVPILQGEHAELTSEDLSPRRLRQRHWLYRSCSAVHSVSHGLHEQLLRLNFPPRKLKVVVNGVDTSRFTPGDRIKARLGIGIPEGATVLGVVGRFGPFKRHRLLIQVFEALADRQPDLHLLIVGGGGPEEASVLQSCKTSRHSHRIWPVGFQADPRPFYHALDLLVAASVNEGLSNAVLEAMACGIPVLAHRACGNAEVISEGVDGFLTDLFTQESLSSALLGVLSGDQKLTEVGAAARGKVMAQFSLEKMARDYETLYRLVARRHAPSRCFPTL